MKHAKLTAFLVLLCTSACGGTSNDAGPEQSAQSAPFTETVDHPYFPLSSALLRTYVGQVEGEPLREEVRTLPERRMINGVMCTGLEQTIFIAGEHAETTTEWYAQDDAGNVWKFAEETLELDEGVFVRSEDSWAAGTDGGEAWVVYPANSLPGTSYAGYAPGGTEEYQVLSTNATAVVPAGVYSGCLEMVEGTDEPDDKDIVLYARGIGRVQETGTDGVVELESVSRE